MLENARFASCVEHSELEHDSLSVPTLTVSTKLLLQNISFECFVHSIIYFYKFQQYLYITKLPYVIKKYRKYSNNI